MAGDPLAGFRGRFYAGILSEEPHNYAAHLSSIGMSHGEILSYLQDRFPHIPAGVLGRVVDQAERVRSLIEGYQAGGPDSQIPRTNIPRNEELPSAYRFIVRQDYVLVDARGVPILDEDGEYQTNARTVVLDLGFNPTLGELQARLPEALTELARRSGSPRVEDEGEWANAGFTVVVVQRRT